MTIILENIRSAWNVGSVMRSCDALGFDLILVGYTPCPVGHNLKLITKTAIGAQNIVKWTHYEHSQEVLDTYKDSVHLAIEISNESHNIYDFLRSAKAKYVSSENIMVWFGNEIHGVSQLVCDQATAQLHLPMKGSKESLNVSSCMCTIGYLFEYVFE